MAEQTLERQAMIGAINGDIHAFSNAFEQIVDAKISEKMIDVRNETMRDMGFKMQADVQSNED